MKHIIFWLTIIFLATATIIISNVDVYAENSTEESLDIGGNLEYELKDGGTDIVSDLRQLRFIYDNSIADKVKIVTSIYQTQSDLVIRSYMIWNSDLPEDFTSVKVTYQGKFGEEPTINTPTSITSQGLLDSNGNVIRYWYMISMQMSNSTYKNGVVTDNVVFYDGALPHEIYWVDSLSDTNPNKFLKKYADNELDKPYDDYEPDGNGGYKPADRGEDDSIPQIPLNAFTATAIDEITDKDYAYVLMNFTTDFNSDYGLYYDINWKFDTPVYGNQMGTATPNIYTNVSVSNVILDMSNYYSGAQSKYIYKNVVTYDWLVDIIHECIDIAGFECKYCVYNGRNGHKHIGKVNSVTIKVAYYDKVKKMHGKVLTIRINFSDGVANDIIISEDEDNIENGEIVVNPPTDTDGSTTGNGSSDLIDDGSFLGTLNNMVKVCQKVFALFKNILSFLPSWAFSGLIMALPFLVILRVMGR